MKKAPNAPASSTALVVGLLAVGCLQAVASDFQSGELNIKSVQGTVLYSSGHAAWSKVKPGMALGAGVELKTGPGSTADLEFNYSGTALRLRPNSSLKLAKLNKMVIEDSTLVDTHLKLESGSLIGSQRKLAQPSTFAITTPKDSATIKGTEYLVAADGTVACFRGEVAVNSAHQGGPINAKVPAGFSFNPVSSKVTPTRPDKFSSYSPDLHIVQNNVHQIKPVWHYPIENPCPEVSPVKGHHGHGHDHDQGHGHDHGHDNHGKDHHGDDGHGHHQGWW